MFDTETMVYRVSGEIRYDPGTQTYHVEFSEEDARDGMRHGAHFRLHASEIVHSKGDVTAFAMKRMRHQLADLPEREARDTKRVAGENLFTVPLGWEKVDKEAHRG